MNIISIEDQKKLKENIDKLYGDIYAVRLRIEIHRAIADVAGNDCIKNNQYWGFVQTHDNVSVAILRLSAIFDKGGSSPLNQLLKILKKNSRIIEHKDINNWRKKIEKYIKNYMWIRHKMIAHTDANPRTAPLIDYETILNIMSELEKKLNAIRESLLIDTSIINGLWVKSTVQDDNMVIADLKDIINRILEKSLTESIQL